MVQFSAWRAVMAAVAGAICLVACHGGPAEHFSVFAKELEKRGQSVQVYALTGSAAEKKFKDEGVALTPFRTVEEVAEAVVVGSRVVLMDVGHPLDPEIARAFKVRGVSVVAYYDNPQAVVSEEYARTFAGVREVAGRVLYANYKLATEPEMGLGYYPVKNAEELISIRREAKESIRAAFFKDYKLEDRGQKLLVYFGANRDDYFGKEGAFAHFLRLLAEVDLSDSILIFQRHPFAKGDDLEQLREWPEVVVSMHPSSRMTQLADVALYFQTSMEPLFALTGIATVEVTKETKSLAFLREMGSKEVSEEERRAIYERIGYQENWRERLVDVLLS